MTPGSIRRFARSALRARSWWSTSAHAGSTSRTRVNSLDHSADPFTIISNMVGLVRPGGIVLLRHKRNEGESARYGGLHQWNFDVVDDSLIVWNNASK